MRYLWLIMIAGASLAGALPAGEQAVDFSGTWLLDPDHSDVDLTPPGIRKIRIDTGRGVPDDNEEPARRPEAPPGARVQKLTLQIVQTEGEMRTIRQFTIDGEEQAVSQKFALDGSQCINVASDGRGEFVSRTAWEKKKLVNSGLQTITTRGRKTEISVKEEYSISKDRKKLTVKTTSITSQGIVKLKQVFIKK